MSVNKNILIVTDGTEAIGSVAMSIKEGLEDYNIKITTSKEFAGTDILPADVFFLGCETASPGSFTYIADLFSHINFASRKCGIFSTNQKAITYLKHLVKDCEADLAEPLIVPPGETIKKADMKKWLKTVIGC